MYAIVDIVGQQFKVEKNKRIFAHRLKGNEGEDIEFDKVMMIDNDGKISVGTPFLKDALVTAKIISHLKGNKKIVFKKKRRKGYKVLNGHRQYLTELKINEIFEKAPERKEATKAGSGEIPEKVEQAKDTVKKEAAPKTTAAEAQTKDKTTKEPVKEKPESEKKVTKKATTAKRAAKPKTTAKVEEKPGQVKKTTEGKKAEGKATAKPTKKAEPKPKKSTEENKNTSPDSTKE